SEPAEETPRFQLVGPNTESKRVVVRETVLQLASMDAAKGGRPVFFLYALHFDVLGPSWDELKAFCLLWTREAMLCPYLFLVIEAHDVDLPERLRMLDYLMENLEEGFLVAILREARPVLDRDVRVLDVEKPAPEEQKDRWMEG